MSINNTIVTLVDTINSHAVPAWAWAIGCTNMYGLIMLALLYVGVAVLGMGAFIAIKLGKHKPGTVLMVTGLTTLYTTLGVAIYVHTYCL